MNKRIETDEILNQIYDTLMGLVGMSEYHVGFPTDRVKNQFIGSNGNDNAEPTIYFELGRQAFELSIKRVTRQN